MRAKSLAALVALLLASALVAGILVFRSGASPQATATAYASAAAVRLAAGQVPSPIAQGDPGTAQQDLTSALTGMGSLKHQVSVQGVRLDDAERAGTVTFAHTWVVHADKEPWTYTTTMPITRQDDTWAGDWSPSVAAPELRGGERLSAVRLPAARGDITGDDGTPIVTARPVQRIGIDRSRVASGTRARASALALAELVDVDAETYARSVLGAGPQAFVEAITYRAPSRDLDRVTARLGDIPGAVAIAADLPLGPTPTFAAPLLGRVGEATAEIVARSGGTVRAGDVVGHSGLQASHQDRLAGVPGYVIRIAPAGAGPARTLHTVDPRPGQPVRTSLDQRLQTVAEQALAEVRPAAALVAIRPSDGHVLVAASGPGGKGYSTATLGQYAPGSTFKAVTALALLRGGLTPTTPVECSPTTTVDGRSFKNYDNYPAAGLGRITFAEAFAHSCNTALIAARDRLQPGSLAAAAAAVGLLAEPSLGLPAALGAVPETNGDTDRAASTIGQGRLVTTPLGMATVAASVASGRPVRPILVTDPVPDGTGPVRANPVTAAEAEQLRALMRKVVTDGSASFLRDVPGPPVIAKTGTAEYGSASPPRTHAWMIAAQGDLAVAVFVGDGSGGARTAGPILESFLRAAADGRRGR